MWAFEWHDIEKELRLSRGEPLFYCQFETIPQNRPIQLVESARTPELNAYLEHISGAVNFVNQTFSLFQYGRRTAAAEPGGAEGALIPVPLGTFRPPQH